MYPTSDHQLSYETDDAVYWFSSAFDPLNNWSAHAVKLWDMHFPTVEHGYHYRKFAETLPDVAALVVAAPSPWAAMQIERQHSEHRRRDWQNVKVEIMLQLVRAKAAQHEDVRECLMATGTKHIYENSPWDDFWGCGADGAGKNQMGEILMRVRDEIRSGRGNNG